MNIWDGYGQWDVIASAPNVSEIKTQITGHRVRWKPNYVSPEVDYVFAVANLTSERATAIDFGCGLGRNGSMLKSRFARVVGYDIPEMIGKYREVHADGGPYDATYSNIEELAAAETVSLVYDSVVFQHILDIEYCRKILNPLLNQPSLLTFVSVKNHHNKTTPLLTILEEHHWYVYHFETEKLSFDTSAHDVVVVQRRPD
jgi:trans-aconitate methyltransferase